MAPGLSRHKIKANLENLQDSLEWWSIAERKYEVREQSQTLSCLILGQLCLWCEMLTIVKRILTSFKMGVILGETNLNTQIMNIKRNITFKLEKRKNKGVDIVENVPIRMRVTYTGSRIDFSTGYRVDVAKWDDTVQRVKSKTTNKLHQTASEINDYLDEMRTELQKIFKEYEVKECIPSPDELRVTFSERMKGESYKEKNVEVALEETPTISLWERFDEFVNINGHNNNWEKSTVAKVNVFGRHLRSFRENLTFEDLDEKGIAAFLDHLQETKGMRNSTLSKMYGILLWFMKWAFEQGYHTNNAYDRFKPRYKKPEKTIVFLTVEELKKVGNVVIPSDKQYLERVRDVFFFCCWTGLRHSDVYNLRKSNIKSDHIELTTVKTSDTLRIDLNKHSRAILAKYAEIPFPKEKVLPVISNQKMNDYLKELGRLAELDEPITQTYYRQRERIDETRPKHDLLCTHTGRRSFICNALALGIPPQVVMKWTGHSDYSAMKPYIAVADSIKSKEMSKFDNI